MKCIRDTDIQATDSKIVGNKAFNLYTLLRKQSAVIRVPKFMVLTTGDSSSFLDITSVIHDVEKYLQYPIIARSSSTVEDSFKSFAGLFDSLVCANQTELIDNIEIIKNGAKSPQVVNYCKRVGISPDMIGVAVLLQEYIDAEMSGVIFTKHPITNDESVIYTEYDYLTSDSVTAGSNRPHSLQLKKNNSSDVEFPFSSLLDIAQTSEVIFGYPLDIEWIVSKNQIWIVQARRITS